MRIAVTGASGFIGRNVVMAAVRHGHSILAVRHSVEKASAATSQYPVDTILTDIRKPEDAALDAIASADVCIHLAWGALHDFNSMAHVDEELPAQVHFLSRLSERGLARLIVAGTCLEYGLQSGQLSESLPTDPVTPYGLAKDTLRRSLFLRARGQQLSLGWCRLFYMYGDCPGRRTLYMQLKDAAGQGHLEFPMSAGEQLRDYSSIEAVAEQLLAVAVTPTAHGIYNVCSGQPISVRRLVEQWIAENGWSISLKLGHYAYPAYEPLAFWGDDRRIRELICRHS